MKTLIDNVCLNLKANYINDIIEIKLNRFAFMISKASLLCAYP